MVFLCLTEQVLTWAVAEPMSIEEVPLARWVLAKRWDGSTDPARPGAARTEPGDFRGIREPIKGDVVMFGESGRATYLGDPDTLTRKGLRLR